MPLLEGKALEGFGEWKIGLPAYLFGAATPGCGERGGVTRLAGMRKAGGDLGVEASADVYIMVWLVGAKEPDFGYSVGT